ncbi:polysaccharide pyruvyl transferase family protein [Candidatus Chloroploca sp. Khr17]|uniref:polysaccharide pyruvyl transferase family protein n=1 Tax=Candidatus Chloroploca sp. Khr17 TaxID=2496869 RepID=UPI0013EC3E73|nr:polysaccharide pyruvyl transferase family protein [Candidatus Chloroploca sp. Khr17]
MSNLPAVRTYHWLQSSVVQNVGDYAGTLVLKQMGFQAVTRYAHHSRIINPGRCLLPIGSVLYDRTFHNIPEPVDVWGCGWRGTALHPDFALRVTFHAVRGPQTIEGLGLPPNTPLGDPALLLPHLSTIAPKHHGRTLVMPHYFRTYALSARQRCLSTGCAMMVPSRIIGRPAQGRRPSPRGLGSMVRGFLALGIPIYSGTQAIHIIAGAGFILTGSLHGAIFAQAYGVPWAAYDDGYIDVPAKWLDWAAYLGIRLDFVKDLREGQHWWQVEGRHGKVRELESLLGAFPYPV